MFILVDSKDKKTYLIEEDAADYIGRAVQTLRVWRTKKMNIGPPHKKARKKSVIIYSVEGLNEWLASQRRKPVQDFSNLREVA